MSVRLIICTTLLLSIKILDTYSQNSNSVTNRKDVSIDIPNDTLLVKKARAGDADAQAFMGRCYYWGEKGVKVNDAEAYRWIQKSVQKKSPYGYFHLAQFYLNGTIVSKNLQKSDFYFDKAITVIKKLAEEGSATAQYYMGEYYEEESRDKALFWYEKAAIQGYADAQYKTGICCKFLDKQKAFEWFKKAADQNHIQAIFEIGNYYYEGDIVNKSKEEAFNWFRKSAEQGYGIAEYRIGSCYEDGNGIEKNLNLAIFWYKKAAEQEVYGALLKLGHFYRDGYGVDRNYDTAIKYLSKAAEEDDEQAYKDLKAMQRKGKAYFQKLPKRCKEDIYELKEDDPFSKLVLTANWSELDEETKTSLRKRFKQNAIRDWGIERATKVAQHQVDIGFTAEQLEYSQGTCFNKRVITGPSGKVLIMSYPHCTYYLLNDSLFGMVWSNGVQVGNTTLIKTYSGDVVIKKD